MPRQWLYPSTKDEWLELRLADITSTEVSALFEMSPYATRFELWHQKKEGEVVQIGDNERMLWGRTLEPVIAQEIARRYGVKVRSLNAYVRHDKAHMGASFDFEIVGIQRPETADIQHGDVADTTLQRLYQEYGTGVLEIKNVDGLIFRDQWEKMDEGGYEAPAHIELQIQHQLECIGRKWTALGVMVGGNDLKLITRTHDAEVGEAMVNEVNGFWQSIHRNDPPEPDFKADHRVIAKMYGYADPGKFADLRDDERIAQLCDEYKEGGDLEKQGKEIKSAAKAELLTLIGDAEKVAADGYTISAGMVAPTTVSYERPGYRNFRVTKKRAKKE